MKRLSFSFLIVIVLSFIIVHSCSSEEDDTTAPNVVQTPEPEPPAPTQYSLTVTAGEGGIVSTEGGTYDEGTELEITATPSEGYRFTGWEGNDSTSESLTITLNSNQTFQALFELIPPVQYTLTLTASEGGTVSSEGGTYDEGTELEITATPSEGYRFTGWEGNDSTSESLTITLNSNQNFQALFELIQQISLKDRLIEIGYNIPKENPSQELIAASSVPQELINDFFEVQSSLNSTIGGYDNYLMVIWDTNENSQNVIDKLKDLRFNESEGWSTVEELGLNCLTGNLWYGPGEPDKNDICINSYEWFLNPQFNNRPQQNQKSLDLYHFYAHEYFHAYQRRSFLDKNMDDAPTWWIEGAAIYFQNLWMLQNYSKFSKLSGLNNQRELTNHGRSQAENYKSYKRIFQGIEVGRGSINENWYLTSLEESYQTRDNTQTFVGIVVAYLAYITSPEIAMIKILEDSYDLGFEGSFEKHTGLNYQEFYEEFNNFMRSENPNSEPPLGMFIKGDINDYADFWNIKVKTQ